MQNDYQSLLMWSTHQEKMVLYDIRVGRMVDRDHVPPIEVNSGKQQGHGVHLIAVTVLDIMKAHLIQSNNEK